MALEAEVLFEDFSHTHLGVPVKGYKTYCRHSYKDGVDFNRDYEEKQEMGAAVYIKSNPLK